MPFRVRHFPARGATRRVKGDRVLGTISPESRWSSVAFPDPMRTPLPLVLLALSLFACERPVATSATTSLDPVLSGLDDDEDHAGTICRNRVAAAKAKPAAPSAPGFDEKRRYILGRALAEPVVFIRTPPPPAVEKDAPESFVDAVRVIARHRRQPAELRDRVLRGGYLYTESPMAAYGLVKELRLDLLFDDEEIFLLRGETVHALKREKHKRGHHYVHADGPQKGREAKIILFDRVASSRDGVTKDVLHRDLRHLRNREGFDRIKLDHLTDDAILAQLRFGEDWVPALLKSEGPHLEIDCLPVERAQREAVATFVKQTTPRRRAMLNLQAVVDDMAHERLPFDRPWGAKDHLSDGQLRPRWEYAFRKGHIGFLHEGDAYAVFDDEGRPKPPQMCVSFILDSFERAAGTWYTNKEASPRARTHGRLDFNEHDIKNRAGVMAFEQFAKDTPALFTHQNFPERIVFRRRNDFFDNLVALADWFQPGDIVAIQGPKRDGYIHQHAILIEDVDPLTGMPHALADQMKAPRHRTWEMIMAEAPLRALIYHVKPKTEVWAALDPEAETRTAKVAKSD